MFPGLSVPAIFPSNVSMTRQPLPSPGPFGQVPRPHRYYGLLRLPALHPAALRCLRLAVPLIARFFVPTAERTMPAVGLDPLFTR